MGAFVLFQSKKSPNKHKDFKWGRSRLGVGVEISRLVQIQTLGVGEGADSVLGRRCISLGECMPSPWWGVAYPDPRAGVYYYVR